MINRLFKLMPFIAVIILLLCIFSCSPEKRLYRLLSKHPELTRHDTVFKTDTITTKRTEHDTTFLNKYSTDTIILHENNMTIKYVNNGKTVYLKGVCDTIRIVKTVPVSVYSVNPVKEVHVFKWWNYLTSAIVLLAIGFVVFRNK